LRSETIKELEPQKGTSNTKLKTDAKLKTFRKAPPGFYLYPFVFLALLCDLLLCKSCASLCYSICHHRKELTSPMTYVVVELCVDCKYTDCAAVCPVEAFHELPDRLYINADTCIDCDACVPECPVEAIFADTNVPENYAHWTKINIDEAPNYPIISQKIPALHGPTCTGPEE